MSVYNYKKVVDGKEVFLQKNGTFSLNETTAREIKLTWWEEVLKIVNLLLPILIKLFGEGQLKLKKK